MSQMLVSGNATKDASVRMTKNGVYVVELTIAESANARDGEAAPTFKTINVWGGVAAQAAEKVKKGDYVVAQGRMSEPVGRMADDGRIFVNYRIDVSESNLYSFFNYRRRRAETVVNGE